MQRFVALWLILLLLSWYLVPVQAARTFTDATWLQQDSGIVTAVPLTQCIWLRPISAAIGMDLMGVGQSSSDNHRFQLGMSVTGKVQLNTRDTSNDLVQIATTITANVWSAACGVWRTTTDRTIYLNGSTTLTNGTNAKTPTAANINRSWVGRGTGLAGGSEMNGDLGIAAFWNEALSNAEVEAFARGVHPRKIRPTALLSCPQVRGDLSPEMDECGARSWALNGTPAQATTHPPVGLFTLTIGR